ncbi:MAG: hypothetical protein O7D29_09935, partial [Gemmatimonadetes bacterium]|nr:hypothetical protein [Gemmatimonadota bacterium]
PSATRRRPYRPSSACQFSGLQESGHELDRIVASKFPKTARPLWAFGEKRKDAWWNGLLAEDVGPIPFTPKSAE